MEPEDAKRNTWGELSGRKDFLSVWAQLLRNPRIHHQDDGCARFDLVRTASPLMLTQNGSSPRSHCVAMCTRDGAPRRAPPSHGLLDCPWHSDASTCVQSERIERQEQVRAPLSRLQQRKECEAAPEAR